MIAASNKFFRAQVDILLPPSFARVIRDLAFTDSGSVIVQASTCRLQARLADSAGNRSFSPTGSTNLILLALRSATLSGARAATTAFFGESSKELHRPEFGSTPAPSKRSAGTGGSPSLVVPSSLRRLSPLAGQDDGLERSTTRPLCWDDGRRVGREQADEF
jgi:hypothetical protein